MKKHFLTVVTLTAAVIFVLALSGCCCSCFNSGASGKVALRNIYSDHMVLQRDTEIKIHGFAEAGKKVRGKFNDEKYSCAVADEKGEFTLTFPAKKAGGPYTLTVEGAGNAKVVLKDILFGEVYFASGQSNMELPVWSAGRFWRSANGDREAAAANYPEIRFAMTPKRISVVEIKDDLEKPISWQVCSPRTIAPCSAVAFYFARQMHKDLQVPVGIINCAWGGTNIEPWISRSAYERANDEFIITQLEQIRLAMKGETSDSKKKFDEAMRKWEARFYGNYAAESRKDPDWNKVGFDDSKWQETNIPGTSGWEERIDGVIRYRREIEIPADMAGRDLILSLGVIDDCDETFFNGVKVGEVTSKAPYYWETRRVYKVPANLVKAGRAVISVRLSDFFAGGGIWGDNNTICLMTADKSKSIKITGKWKCKLEFAADIAEIGIRPYALPKLQQYFPCALFNAMTNAWTKYQLRGVIWYQGCANSGNAKRYSELFPMLIEDWRRQWNNSDMPFLFCQLAGFHRHSPANRQPADAWMADYPAKGTGFTELRESQAEALKLKNTGMAVTIDVSDPFDIHPQQKQVVGFRLAKEAQRIVHGSKEVSAGPYFKSMTLNGNKAVLEFTNTGSGLVSRGKKVDGFAVAGENKRFYPANAVIKDGKITVSAPEVAVVSEVRYAWMACPENANVFNKEGFPLCPFRAVAK